MIIVHAGTAHLDDFLAAAFLAHKTGEQIIRKKKPTEEDFESDNWVIDFGLRYEPEKRNFDHHQIKDIPVCAFTQVLEHFGMRDYEVLPWIRYVEVWDASGPSAAMHLLHAVGDVDLLVSPIHKYLLEEFSSFEGGIDSRLYSIMVGIGKWIDDEFARYRRTEAELAKNAKVEVYRDFIVADYSACEAIDSFQAMKTFEKKNKIDLIYSVNTRGAAKYRMIRRDEGIDFSYVSKLAGVHFVHQNGFLVAFDGDWRQIIDLLYIYQGINIYGDEHYGEILQEKGFDKLIEAGELEEVIEWVDHLFDVFKYKITKYIYKWVSQRN